MDRQKAIERIRNLRMRTQSRGAEPAEEEQAVTLAKRLQRKYAITGAELGAKPSAESLEEIFDRLAAEAWQRFLKLEEEIAKPGWPWQLDYNQLLERKCCIGGHSFYDGDRECRASGLDLDEINDRQMKVYAAIEKAMKPFLREFRLQRRDRRESEKKEVESRRKKKADRRARQGSLFPDNVDN